MRKLLICVFLLAAMQAAPAFTRKGTSGRSITTNGSQADVQAAINSAADGSTVIIPGGTFTWTGQLRIEKKAVSLAGMGTGETIIRNENGGSTLIVATSGKNGNIAIYGIKFLQIADNGAGRGYNIAAGRDESTRYTVLVHDCSFDQGTVYGYSVFCQANGIIFWNDWFKGSGGQSGMGGISFAFGYGDYEYAHHPLYLGAKDPDGLHNSYVEDCEFMNGSIGMANFDSNSRVVWRHNTMQDAACGSHGQETSPIGTLSWEFYDNTCKITPNNPFNLNYWVQIRGGTGIFTGNTLDEVPWGKSQFQLNVFSVTRGANDNAGGSFCPIEYPAPRQTGWSWANNNANWGKVEDEKNPQLLEGGRSPGYFLPNGKGAQCDPVYAWGDTGPGAKSPTYMSKQTYQPDDCGNGQVIETYLQEGRDYFVNKGAKPGWTAYQYPHPLRGSGGPNPTPTPQPTATPEPTATPPEPTPTPNPTPEPTPPPSNGSQYSNWLDQLSDWIRQHPATPNQ